MRLPRHTVLFVFTLLILGCFSAPSAYAQCVLTSPNSCINAGAGNWSNGLNWSGGVPDSTATNVCITNATGIVGLDISPNIASLQLEAGNALNFNGGTNLTVNGTQIINRGAI